VNAGLPLNSAGKTAGTLDVVVLFVVLGVVLGFYIILRIARAREARRKGREEAFSWVHKAGAAPTARIGSLCKRGMEQQRMSPVGTLMPEKYKDLFNESNPLQAALQDALAGFTTGLAALSDAIAVSFMTGVSPQNAMWGAVIMSFITALLGDRPGMVSSTSVATALILANVSQDEEHGMGLAAFCVLICGGVQLLCGTLRLSRFVTLIPHPVMLGFVNGVGILMIQLELRQFSLWLWAMGRHAGDHRHGPHRAGDHYYGLAVEADPVRRQGGARAIDRYPGRRSVQLYHAECVPAADAH
jgi:hypothetical protein